MQDSRKLSEFTEMYLCLLYNILKLTIAFLLAVSLRRYFELGRCYFFFTECRILFSSCLPCIYVPLDLGLKLSLLHLSTEASTSGQESRYTVGQLPVAFTSQWMGITTLHREITSVSTVLTDDFSHLIC